MGNKLYANTIFETITGNWVIIQHIVTSCKRKYNAMISQYLAIKYYSLAKIVMLLFAVSTTYTGLPLHSVV